MGPRAVRNPADVRLATTCCGANRLALVDGEGRVERMIATEMGVATYLCRNPRLLPACTKPPLGTEPEFILY